MKKVKVKFKFLSPIWQKYGLKYATEMSVGLDLRAAIEEDHITVLPNERVFVNTGLAIEILEPNIAGFIFSRSGLGTKEGLVVTQGVGVIDPDYRGEIIVSLLNISKQPKIISKGERIAQLLFLPAYQAEILISETLSSSKRGAGGFGHTGRL